MNRFAFFKVLCITVLVAALPVLGYWYVGVYSTEAPLRAAAEGELRQTADQLAAEVDAWIDENRAALTEAAALPGVKAMEPAALQAAVDRVDGDHEWVYVAHVVDTAGNNVARSDGKPLVYYGDRGYFKAIVDDGAPFAHIVAIGRTNNQPALVLAQAITDAQDQLAGLIVTGTRLADISATVVDRRLGETGYAILVDDNRRAIAHGDAATIGAVLMDLDAHPALQTPAFDQVQTIVADGVEKLALVKPLELGWQLVFLQHTAEAHAAVAERYNTLWLVTGSALALALAVSVLLARRGPKGAAGPLDTVSS
ncbi:MAG: cache domain-containing protein [Candidatus Competibacterales bacterium]